MTAQTLDAAAIADMLARIARGAPPALLHAGDARWRGAHPFNDRTGPDAIAAVWAEIGTAILRPERRDLIRLMGPGRPDPRLPDEPGGRMLFAAMGHLQGVFARPLCGIRPTHGVVQLRVAEVHELTSGRITRSWVLFDLLDLMRQAGVWPIAPQLGSPVTWPGPATGDGLSPAGAQDTARADAAFDLVMGMHAALAAYDGASIDSIPQAPFWDEDFYWYGPAGIGTARALDGFRNHHQIPFLAGYPDRKGAGHYVRLAVGDYVVTGGWPSVTGTHLGQWLGLPGTGKPVAMRVMDFYRCAGGRIAENWVPMDVIDILRQLGLDVLERMAARG